MLKRWNQLMVVVLCWVGMGFQLIGAQVFNRIETTFPVTHSGASQWADADGDRDFDVLLTGEFQPWVTLTEFFRNEDNTQFTGFSGNFMGVTLSDAAWGDYDNDGDLDVLVVGQSDGLAPTTRLYRNDGNTVFSVVPTNLPGISSGMAAWGDYDNDGDLDLLLSGHKNMVGHFTKVFRNDGGFSANQPPVAPTGLQSVVHNDSVTLSWRAATDFETPSMGLSYNLRIGTTPGGVEVMSPMAQAGSGHRMLAALGNANQDTVWTILNLPAGKYYWSVQAIDHAFAGSAFAAEDSFVISITGIDGNAAKLPENFILLQNYPNPFNPLTNVEFGIGNAEWVKLTVYDVLGRKVKTLVNERRPAGTYTV